VILALVFGVAMRGGPGEGLRAGDRDAGGAGVADVPPASQPDASGASSEERDAAAPVPTLTDADAAADAGALADARAGDRDADSDGGVVVAAHGHPDERDPPTRPASHGPRQVTLRPSLANVEIAIDGGPLRAFGPSFREVALAPGRHTFRLVGGANCCVDRTLSREIPAGDGPLELPLPLEFRPASVYVVANVLGDVQVTGADSTVRGRTRAILSVPMARAEDTRRLTVTAEGHRVYTGVVRLRAGQLTEHLATLEVAATAPDTPPSPPPD
jgi:hypothetical protein